MNDEKFIEELKGKWDKAFSDIAKPKPKPQSNEMPIDLSHGPAHETIILRTRCGCEREMVVPWLPDRRVFQMPLYPRVHFPPTSRDLYGEPIQVKTRTFVYAGSEVHESRTPARVFIEMPEERD